MSAANAKAKRSQNQAEKVRPVSVYFDDPRVVEAIREIAKAEHRGLSSQITWIIEQWLKEHALTAT